MTSDDLTQTAFRIADEASVSLLECSGIRLDHVTFEIDPEELDEPMIMEAIDYLVARNLAHRFDAGGRIHVILETNA
jgi:hypothetical protein